MKPYTRILLGMLVGVVLGLLVGPNAPLMPRDAVRLLPGIVVHAEPTADSAPAPRSSDVREARLVVVQPGSPAWAEIAWGDGAHGFVPLVEPGVTTCSRVGQALVDGTAWIGRLFLAAIRMVVVPLVFCSLTVGVASLGDLRTLGRLGGRTLAWFLGTGVLAVILGLVLSDLVRPGRLVSVADRARLLATYAPAATAALSGAPASTSVVDRLVALVPVNPVAAMAQGDMLQIIVFAVLFGIALTRLPPDRARPVLAVLEGANDAVVVLVHFALLLAPFGVAALLFEVVGTTGVSVLLAVSAYGGVVLLGLLVQVVVVFGGAVTLGARVSFVVFLRAMWPALLVAFGTSSSSATLPVTMRAAEDNVGVSKRISSFVLPLGASVKRDGTAIFQAVATVFVAQIYGVELSIGNQVTVVFLVTLASLGAAGVPGAGMITLATVLTTLGLPVEGLALVLGLDRLLDMFRTTVNVLGSAVGALLVARLEGEELRIG